MGRAKGWTCQRQTSGTVCRFHNPPGTRKCGQCGKSRPPRKRPAHMVALQVGYEEYVKLNGGEFCGICGRQRTTKRRLDRDHDHKTGKPRGLLCHRCNRWLKVWVTIEWLERAILYLRRSK